MIDIKNRIQAIENKAKHRQSVIRTDNKHQLPLPLEELLPIEANSPNQPYPTHFTRLPVFAPLRNRSDADTEWSEGKTYETSWGRITRYGPGLDMYDEDTLLGLLGTAQEKRLTGLRQTFPLPLNAIDGAHTTIVHYGKTSAYAVNKYLNRPTGGNNLTRCRNSIRRIALTQFIIYRKDLALEGKVHLFDYRAKDDFKGTFEIQFSPVMIRLLKEYTYIDMNVRMHPKLNGVGKALHRFLSGQPAAYKIQVCKLKDALGYRGESKYFKRDLASALKQLHSIGWIKNWSIEGTGRRTPFLLCISR
jgi:hypothetical protein